MEKVKKITLKINQKVYVFYEYGGERFFYDARKVLRKIFKDQGELYEKIFNIDRETAKLAGWHPESRSFDSDCGGWQYFVKNKGRIHKEEVIEEFDINEFVHNYVGF